LGHLWPVKTVPKIIYNESSGTFSVYSLTSEKSFSKQSIALALISNVTHYKVMHFGYNNRKADYFMDGVNFEYVTEEKDLDVIISEDLK